MRILHTSDWHLGRQLHHASLLEDQRHVLAQIVATVEARAVDVVLVAGDVYDRSVPSAEAVALLDETLDAITQRLGVPVVVVAGNHDGAERLAAFARPLARAGIHLRGPLADALAPVVLRDAHGEVAFYGLPYAEPVAVRHAFGAEVRSHEDAIAFLTQRIAEREASGRRCVVLGHCFLAGSEESASERPLSVGGVAAVAPRHFERFCYAALGHLHAPQHRGARHVRYSGSILKYSFSEAQQAKSATLVELDGDGRATIEPVPLAPLRDVRVVEGELDAVLAQGRRDPRRDDYLLVRLLDRHAILDAMGRLREVYPNVMQLERPALAQGGERRAPSRESIERGHLAMFRDFYAQTKGEPLDDARASVVADLLGRLLREDA
ncbi:MAG: exonuclease SbcCD subunit D [Myxococcota bacterium]